MVRFHWVRSASRAARTAPPSPSARHPSFEQVIANPCACSATPLLLPAAAASPPHATSLPSSAAQHVEGQQSAWVPHKGIVEDEASGVRHITVDMEVRAAAAPRGVPWSPPVCLVLATSRLTQLHQTRHRIAAHLGWLCRCSAVAPGSRYEAPSLSPHLSLVPHAACCRPVCRSWRGRTRRCRAC